jgi:hypothetical protein
MKNVKVRNLCCSLLVIISIASVVHAADIDFAAIVSGIRPRGYGAGSYALASAVTGGKTYHVATTGSDSNAGSSATPFRTINKAAQVSVAGDVVVIHDGTYSESVLIKNSGVAGKPIVFQAANRGGVLLTGANQYSFQGNDLYTGNTRYYVTVKGIIFRNYAPLEPTTADKHIAAVRAATGWVIEDCLFDRAGNTGAMIWGLDAVVRRCTFQYNWVHAMHGWGPSNGATTPSDPKFVGMSAQVIDCILKGNNVKNQAQDAATSSSVHKFTNAKNVVIDNVESCENNGHGIWFDGGCFGYVVRNSYFHDNKGSGLDLEISWGGLVEKNVFSKNGKPGLLINNTSGVESRDNLFYHNETSMELVDYTRSDAGIVWRLKDINIHHNFFKGWTKVQTGAPAASVYHAISSYNTTPQTQNVIVDYNTYDREPVPAVSGTQLRPVLGRWLVYGWADTIAEVQAKLTWEMHGAVASIPWPPKPIIAVPIFSPNGGTFNNAVSVSIASSAGTSIHYTIDGSTPTSSSTLYTGPITITATKTIRAIATADTNNSAVVTAVFTIQAPPPPLPLPPPPPPPGDEFYVSDIPWISAVNGWGPAERDKSCGESAANDGKIISLNGVTYAKGLGVHALSDVRVRLGGEFSTFTSDIGVDDEVGDRGSVVFQVFADNVKIFDSGAMTGATATKTVKLNVIGKQELRLVVTNNADNGNSDHADWAGARLRYNEVWLSDLMWTSAYNGWGPVEKDKSNGEQAAGDGKVIALNNVTYSKGLGVHAASYIRYNLSANYTRFISDIGIDDEVGSGGSVIFEVYVDGARIYDSGVMTGATATKSIDLDVSGKNELRLVVTTSGDNNSSDHGDWAGAKLRKGSTPAMLAAANASLITSPATASSDRVVVGETVSFSVAYSGKEFVSEWSFGDGERGSGPLAQHIFVAPGTYTATVIVAFEDHFEESSVIVEVAEGTTDTNVIDLGQVKAGTRVKLKLQTPVEIGKTSRTKWTLIESSLPKNLKLTRGQIIGRTREPGEFTFTVKIAAPGAIDLIQKYRMIVE